MGGDTLPEVKWVEIQSKVAQAKSQLEVARKNLADCRLVAPVSGIIGKKLIGVGETALPSQAVVSILDISTVKVKVAVPEAEVGGINANTPTSIQVEAINGSYQGGQIEKGVQADALTHTGRSHQWKLSGRPDREGGAGRRPHAYVRYKN